MKIEVSSAKRVLFLLLIAALMAGSGIFGFSGQSAAAATTKYNVQIQSGSPSLALILTSKGSSLSQQGTGEGITFQMVVDGKAKTEKLKTGPATYYPVTILAKSFKVPTTYYTLGNNKFKVTEVMTADAKGKLYTSGGDVDVSTTTDGQHPSAKIGDGVADPEGSLIIPISLAITTYGPNGKTLMKMTSLSNFTTGRSKIAFKKSKSGLEGKALPDDSAGILSNPLAGTPLDLNAGTGALVSTAGFAKVKLDPKGVPAASTCAGCVTDASLLGDVLSNPTYKAIFVKYTGDLLTQYAAVLESHMKDSMAATLDNLKGGNILTQDGINSMMAELWDASSGGAPQPVKFGGTLDLLGGQIWVMQITGASK